MSAILDEIKRLPRTERQELADELRRLLHEVEEERPFTRTDIDFLDAQRAATLADPASGHAWEDVRAGLLAAST